MEAASFEQALRRLRNAEPFRPFVIRLIEGELILVDEPLGLAFSGGTGAFIAGSGDMSFFKADQIEFIQELADPDSD